MTALLLTATHLAAFTAGGVLAWWLIRRFATATEVNGHPALEFTTEAPMESPKTPGWSGVITLFASFLLIVIGVQVYQGQAAEEAARERAAQRDAADRAYADCLTEFASDLVKTIDARTTANVNLERAIARKDQTLDHLLAITELARRTPPEATAAQFDAALKARIEAQQNYDRVREQVSRVREDNPYVLPEAVCER